MSLADAGRLLGITANAVRARAKKSPEAYGLERDNAGKLWVTLDLQRLSAGRAAAEPGQGSVKPAIEVQLAAAEARADAAERARDVAEADRDRWQAMAERLAARPRWWPF